jgi:hypothetical protein
MASYKEHFASFCTGGNQACSYEDWIDALTSSNSEPTNASACSAPTDNLLDFEGMSKVIDPKYYQEDCEERKFWNDNIAGSDRTEVPARQSDESLTSESLADFMPFDAPSEGAKEVKGDLLSFD